MLPYASLCAEPTAPPMIYSSIKILLVGRLLGSGFGAGVWAAVDTTRKAATAANIPFIITPNVAEYISVLLPA